MTNMISVDECFISEINSLILNNQRTGAFKVNTPIGLILCTGKNQEHIELLKLDQSNIRVADYLTILPSKEILQNKLHKAINKAQQKINKDNEKHL